MELRLRRGRRSIQLSTAKIENVGAVRHVDRGEETPHEAGVSVGLLQDGIHIGAYVDRVNDIELLVPVGDCQSIVDLLRRAIERFDGLYGGRMCGP
jgi:hypothetical protein